MDSGIDDAVWDLCESEIVDVSDLGLGEEMLLG